VQAAAVWIATAGLVRFSIPWSVVFLTVWPSSDSTVSHTSRQSSLPGMGLPIAKAIVGAHGGTIGVVSQLGQGSVFSVRLPIYSNLRAKPTSGLQRVAN